MFRSLPKAPSLRELSPQVTEGVPLLFRDRQQDPQGEPAVGPMKGHGAVVALGGRLHTLQVVAAVGVVDGQTVRAQLPGWAQ